MYWYLNTPNWMGKAAGFACALLWVPTDGLWLSVGIIAGIVCGHVYDMWSAAQSSPDLSGLGAKLRHATAASAAHELQFLFLAAGRISKASGTVQSRHVQQTEQIIKALKLDNNGRNQAIAWFNEGKDPKTGFAQLARQCLQSSTQSGAATRTAVVQCLCDIAVIEPNRESVEELKRLAALIGFAAGRVGQLYGEAHSRRTFRREPPSAKAAHNNPTQAPGPSMPQVVLAAYKYLDVPPDSGLDTVKKAYRRSVSRYHPDRLGASATDQETSYAQRKMVELRDALETIEGYLASH